MEKFLAAGRMIILPDLLKIFDSLTNATSRKIDSLAPGESGIEPQLSTDRFGKL